MKKPKANSKIACLFNNKGSVGICIIVLTIFLGSIYISVVNTTADKGFEVDEMKNNLAALKKDNRTLELEVAEAMSMQNIKQASEGMELEKISEAEYLPSQAGLALGE